jgi:hypothetical protein
LTPELKEFIDRAIVPALVEQYLVEMRIENKLAADPSHAAHSHRNTAAPKVRGNVRP